MKNAKPQVELVSKLKKKKQLYLHTNIYVDVYIAGKKINITLYLDYSTMLCCCILFI